MSARAATAGRWCCACTQSHQCYVPRGVVFLWHGSQVLLVLLLAAVELRRWLAAGRSGAKRSSSTVNAPVKPGVIRASRTPHCTCVTEGLLSAG